MLMQIDPKTPIAGLKPSVLKRVFARGGFRADQFARTLALDPPSMNQTLRELVRQGWITPDLDNEGWWRPTEKADRLVAMPLLPRLPTLKARQVLERVIAEADEINRDGSYSQFVPRLALFGSLMTASEGDTVGDVDLGYEVKHRADDREGRRLVRTAELESCPASLRSTPYYWPRLRILKRLKVDRRVSPHAMDELETEGYRFSVIYTFDEATGASSTRLPWGTL